MVSGELMPRAVVIGASAGAIDALKQIIPQLPHDLSIPVIIVVHLAARKESLLPQIFRPLTPIGIREPNDKEPVGAGIWFAPPDYHLLVEKDHTFSLSLDTPVKFSRPSIDVLFSAAAEAYGDGLLAVLLTGANDDGADGLRDVRQRAGRVIVQDPATAEASEMPKAGLRVATPIFTGSTSMIGAFLATLLQRAASDSRETS